MKEKLIKYNWQQMDWPNFTYDINVLQEYVYQYVKNIGQIEGELAHLSPLAKEDISLQLMVSEAVKTSEIEGEYIDREDVMSSFKHHLGLPSSRQSRDVRALGITKLITAARQAVQEPLSKSLLFTWHKLLLGYSEGYTSMLIGGWREHAEVMQVVSGRVDKLIFHFEAPPSDYVPGEMKNFIAWFNETAQGQEKEVQAAPVRAALAHLYFESIHPFEDGNGRIGRAIAEKALSQSLGYAIPMSISSCIEPNKAKYYAALKKAQASNKVTEWIIYFIEMLLQSQKKAQESIHFILKKASFFDRHREHLNDRQMKVINRMLEDGPDSFEGGITPKKYIGITRCSKATATRDLADLLNTKILYQLPGSGRSTHYAVKFEI